MVNTHTHDTETVTNRGRFRFSRFVSTARPLQGRALGHKIGRLQQHVAKSELPEPDDPRCPPPICNGLRLAHGEAIITAHIHPNSTTAQAQALWVTAKAALHLHEWDTAVNLLQTAGTLYERTGPAPEWLIEDLGDAAQQGGHYQTSADTRETLVERKQRRLGDKHPDTLRARGNLASSYLAAGRTNDAIVLGERVLADRVDVLGDKHPDTLRARSNLANFKRASTE